MNVSLSSNIHAASAAVDANASGSKPKDWDIEVGRSATANLKADADDMPQKADAMLQDVLLHSDTDETEPSNLSKDAVNSNADTNHTTETSAGTSGSTQVERVGTTGKKSLSLASCQIQ